MLTGWTKSWSHYTVRGLRDPLARRSDTPAADSAWIRRAWTYSFSPTSRWTTAFRVQREFDTEKQSLEQTA